MAPCKSNKTAKASKDSTSEKVDPKQSKASSLNLDLPCVLPIGLNQAAAYLESINSSEEFTFEEVDGDTLDMPETDDPQVLESLGDDDDSCRERSSRHLEFQLSREQVLVNLP